jgi:hypothetical protein
MLATANVEPGDEPDELHGASGSYVVLTATDEGVGMSPEVRHRIFDRFFTTKGPGRGTGLGLAAVQRFATESGDSVTVCSEPGQGTRVAIYLPRASVVVGAGAPDAAASALGRGADGASRRVDWAAEAGVTSQMLAHLRPSN